MSGLAKRIVTAVVLLPPLLLAIHVDYRLLAGLLAIVSLLGAWELSRLHTARGLDLPTWLPMIGAILMIASYGRFIPLSIAASLVLLIILSLLTLLLKRDGKMLVGLPCIIFICLYVGLLPAHLLGFYDLGRLGESNPWPATYALVLVWGCDTFAFAIGSLLGRHKLMPRVSPSKSWEGAIAGLLASVGLAILCGRWVPDLSLGARVIAGLLVGVFAQLGDLGESLMKREAQTKDSGKLLPGHGGILDRIDSLILAVPVLYYWLHWSAGIP